MSQPTLSAEPAPPAVPVQSPAVMGAVPPGGALAQMGTPVPVPITVIEPKKGWVAVDWRELWNFRELLWVMITRDLKARYKQTVLGAAWAVLTPVMNMVVMTIVFGSIAKLPTDGIPKPLFYMAATVPWALFTTALNGAANSLVANGSLIKKIYFPRLYIPISSVSTALVDFLIAMGVLLIMCLAMGYIPTVNSFFLPLWVLLMLITALGAGLWLGALMVLFRDVRTLIPFGVQAWMYATPIPYTRAQFPKMYQAVVDFNPMTQVVEGFRWALLGTDTAPPALSAGGVGVALLILVSGLYFFRRMEKTFADIA